MSSEKVCRLCLATDAPIHSIADTPLQEVYEKLTNVSLNTSGKPVMACSFCYWQLRKCHKLMTRSLRAEHVLNTILQTGASVIRGLIVMIDRTMYKLKYDFSIPPMELTEFITPQPIKEGSKNKTLSHPYGKEFESEKLTYVGNVKLESSEDLQDVKVEEENVNNVMNEVLSDAEDIMYEEAEAVEDTDDDIDDMADEEGVEVIDDTNIEMKIKLDPLLHTENEQVEESSKKTEASIGVFNSTGINSTDNATSSEESAIDADLDLSLLHKRTQESTRSIERELNHVSNSRSTNESEFIKTVRNKSRSIRNDNTGRSEVESSDCTDVNNVTRGDDCETNNVPYLRHKNVITNKRIRPKDFCFFCKSLVLNFARHLLRRHDYETEVQKILSLPKKSIERNHLITKLRKKGNFLQNSVNVTKPMRKLKHADYLPCTNCLGFYSKRLLWKHTKKCSGQNSKNVQSEAQNYLIRNLKIDEKLKNTVFPRMRADKISLVAKSDVLICAFGSQYLKTHEEPHCVNVVSRKMREMAKLLIEIKRNKPSVKDFFDVLKPENYNNIVSATKVVGKYDTEKDSFHSPTFAMNISTSIKQCCNIAMMFALKKQEPYNEVNTAEVEAALKTLIRIINSNWKFDISSQAATDLHKKKLNKVTIVSLVKDLKIIKEFLDKKSDEAANKIKEGSYHVETYTQLLETIYCRVMLLNRRKAGELQRIKIQDYLENDNNNSEKCKEFDQTLTALERILVKKFKLVVIRGKHGRVVPVFFNKELQEDIKLLLTIRNKFVSTSNELLFGGPGFENSINDYKVLERYSRLSGTKIPRAISSTGLRKHLATLSQIFSITENDMEQLATLMGHTNEAPKKSDNLPDYVFQTEKIWKLLKLMKDGKTKVCREKRLDELDLDLNEELEEGNIDNKVILDYDLPITQLPIQDFLQHVSKEPQPGPSGFQNKTSESDLEIRLPLLSNEKHVRKGKKRMLVPWTTEQKQVVTAFFKHHIKNKQPPKKNECETLKEHHPELLLNKDWLKIKVFVQNSYSKK